MSTTRGTISIENRPTQRSNHTHIPAASSAAVQLANMRAWLAGVAMITVLSSSTTEREMGNARRPFLMTSSIIKYRTHRGVERTWDRLTIGMQAGISEVRLEWWTHRLFIASLLESRYPCARCSGTRTAADGTTKIDLRYSGLCNRCWGRRTDPVILNMIAAGEDPTKHQIITPTHD